MKQVKILCDVKNCNAPAQSVYYHHDRKMDGAGSMENVYDTADLCHNHAVSVLNLFLKAGIQNKAMEDIEQVMVASLDSSKL